MAATPNKFSRLSVPAAIILTVLLVVLAFRLTASETLRETVAQKAAAIALQNAPKTPESTEPVPIVGPVFTAAYAGVGFLLAGAAAVLAAWGGGWTWRRMGHLGWVGGILGLLAVSTWQAANRFHALIGTMDVAAALLAGWTVAVLCHERLLGARGRQAVMAALVAILAVGCAKGMMQYFVEFPETAKLVQENPDKAMRENGIDPDDSASRGAFLARLNSAEVSGYGAMSNVFATQLIAYVALLAGLGMAGILLRRQPAAAVPVGRRGRQLAPAGGRREEVPVYVIALTVVGILLAAGLALFPLTESKGGTAAAALALAAVMLGGIFRTQVAARRRMLLMLLAVAALALPMAVVTYGLLRHGLPTRSLLFRWQYWTGTAPMVRAQPAWGVGLNNFGDYYLRYKMPSSPEDVKDPHSFFVRWAAEGGVPAAAVVGLLLVWMVWGAFSRRRGVDASAEPATPGLWRTLIQAAVGAQAWVDLHFLAESPNEFTIILTALFALAAWGVFAAVMALCDTLTREGTRYLTLAAVAGALAMLLYDQVNMALVTGPAAMLFWMMLGVADSDEAAASAAGATQTAGTGPRSAVSGRVWAWAAGAGCFAAGAAVCLFVLVPLAQGDLSWDPAPYEYAYIRELNAGHTDRALLALDDALARWPNSIELLLQKIRLKRETLHRPVAADIRRTLALDDSNASLRMMLALPDTDLPPAERVAALQEALAFDAQLPPGELKHLKAGQIKTIQDTIARLK